MTSQAVGAGRRRAPPALRASRDGVASEPFGPGCRGSRRPARGAGRGSGQAPPATMFDGQATEATLELVAIDDGAQAIVHGPVVRREQVQVRRPARSSALRVAGAHEEPVRQASKRAGSRSCGRSCQIASSACCVASSARSRSPRSSRHGQEPVGGPGGQARIRPLVAVLGSDHGSVSVPLRLTAPARPMPIAAVGVALSRVADGSPVQRLGRSRIAFPGLTRIDAAPALPRPAPAVASVDGRRRLTTAIIEQAAASADSKRLPPRHRAHGQLFSRTAAPEADDHHLWDACPTTSVAYVPPGRGAAAAPRVAPIPVRSPRSSRARSPVAI